MDFELPQTLLSPRERTSVITRLNRLTRTEAAFVSRAYSPIAVTAYPSPGHEGVRVDVAVIIDRPIYNYADLGKAEHDLQQVKVSDRIRMQFYTIAQAALKCRLDFGCDILGERLLVDPHLERATPHLAESAGVSVPFLVAYNQARNIHQVSSVNAFAAMRISPQSIQEISVAAAVREALGTGDAWQDYGVQEIRIAARAALERLRQSPDVESLWAATREAMRFGGHQLESPRLTMRFREARMDALARVQPAHQLDAKAAATGVLQTLGPARPVAPTMRDSLVSSLGLAPGGPIHIEAAPEHEGEDFLL